MTVRWGIIGCGDVARKRVAAAIQVEPRSQLVAGCRRDVSMLDQFCDQFEIPQRYTSAAQLLADPQIDAVYIATPVKEHLPQTLAAAAAGKHVLVEKPMGMNADECQQMVDACKSAGVKLGVAYYRRFYPLVHRMEELLRSGEIGVPLAISAVTATPLDKQQGEEGYWRRNHADSGGGALMDVGSHRINLFLHLMGQVTAVRAFCETVAASYEVDDTAAVLMKFETGATGMLQCHFGVPFDPDEFAITGDAGRLTANPLNGDTLTIATADGVRTESHPPDSNFCTPLVADFVSAILEDRPPRVAGLEGLATNAVMDQAYDDCGRPKRRE